MTTPRRYDETEIAEILRRAAEAEAHATVEPSAPSRAAITPSADSSSAGLTLAEVRDIAAEVGIAATNVDRAARSLDAPPARAPARFLGTPRSVSHTVKIDRALTDDEWHRFVARLRDTFDAPGQVDVHGPLRSWHNGNLQVHVEPWDDHYRVRMQTRKGSVDELMIGALSVMLIGLIMGVAILAKRGLDVALFLPALFEAFGLGMLATTRLSLPKWADERAGQFEAIADHLPQLMASTDPTDG